ncbi:MAG TPA: glycosyltransferase family 39 protein, partial [Chryseolinea sp.]|nr:glycosyltransferase family 39 protein [Chryseolinea sp.]
EYLHLDQGDHLAWGYLSVPPFTSWISYIIKLLGNSVFWIKFFPAAFGALTILVVWKTIEELKGNLFALILGATGVLFSVLLRLNILYQPNSFDVLCWTTFYLVVIRYINTENPKWLFIGAVVLATGFLNKYNIVFLLIGFLPAILITGERRLLLDRRLLIAAALGILIVLPNLIWQYQNQFPIFHHMKLLADTQLVNVNRWDFLMEQFLFFLGSLFVIVSALYALLLYKPFNRYRTFFWSLIFTVGVFTFLKAKAYYAIGIYPVYVAFGSVYLADILKTDWKRYLQPVAIIVPVMLFIPLYRVGFPNRSPEYISQHGEKYKALGLLRWEDGKDHQLPQDFADMLGWKELAGKVDKVYAAIPNPEKTIILCDNYGLAGAINYYTRKGIKAVSFNADYVNWIDLQTKYTNLIRVVDFSESDNELKEIGPYFNTSLASDSIANKYAREYRTTILTFIGAKVDINGRIKDEIEEVKNFH